MRKIYFKIAISMLIIVCTIVTICEKMKFVEYVYLNTYLNQDIELNQDVLLVNDVNDPLFNKLNLKEYNIDFNKSTVILSYGKIQRIELMKKYTYIPLYTHFIKIYLINSNPGSINIYLLPKNHVYFDERYDSNRYIINMK